MPAFQFPDPAVEQSVINTLTGTTYVWRADPGKWVAAQATNDAPIIQDQLTYVIQTDKILRSSQPAIELVDSENNVYSYNINNPVYLGKKSGNKIEYKNFVSV